MIRKMSQTLLILCAAVVLSVLMPKRTEAQDVGTMFVVDYSGSMWNGTENGPDTYYERTENLLGDTLDHMLANTPGSTVGLVTFGDKNDPNGRVVRKVDRDPGCKNINFYSRAGFAINRPNVEALKSYIDNQLIADGVTPLDKASIRGIDAAKDIILDDRARAMRIVIVSDMKDTCIDGRHVRAEDVDPETYCDLAKKIEAARISANTQIRRQLGIGEAIVIQFVISVDPEVSTKVIDPSAPEAGAIAPTAHLARCLPGSTLVEPVGVDDYSALARQIAVTTDILPRVKVRFRADRSIEDSLERPIGMDAPVLILQRQSDGEVSVIDRFSGDHVVEAARGEVHAFQFDAGEGEPLDGTALFNRDEDRALPWRLPRITYFLTNKPGTARIDAPVRWTLTPDSDPASRRTFDDDGEITFDLPKGTYHLEARLDEKRPLKTTFSVDRKDRKIPLATDIVPRPPEPERLSVSFGINRSPPSLPMGTAPKVTLAVTDGTPPAATWVPGDAALGLLPRALYRVDVLIGGEEKHNVQFSLNDRATTDSLTIDLPPPLIDIRRERRGVWTLKRLDIPSPGEDFAGSRFRQTLHPGRYALALDGRSLCPPDRALELEYGDALVLGFGDRFEADCQ